MSQSQPYILADIGGTHLRYAILEGNDLSSPIKLKLADYDNNIEDCFHHVIEINNLYKDTPIAIAITETFWDIEGLKRSPLNIKFHVNDFDASAAGVVSLKEDQVIQIHRGKPSPEDNRTICGPGTGFGIAYLVPLKDGNVRRFGKMGAHFIACAQTDEQYEIIRIIRGMKRDTDAVIFENMVSGRGLPYLYKAVCMLNDKPYEDLKNEDILDLNNVVIRNQILRLFHEFFGLTVNTAVITGQAFDGVYLDGGLVQSMYQKSLFDKESFLKMLHLNPDNKKVQDALKETSVSLVNAPFIAIDGLKNIIEESGQ